MNNPEEQRDLLLSAIAQHKLNLGRGASPDDLTLWDFAKRIRQELSTENFETYGTDPTDGTVQKGKMVNTHSPTQCSGEYCVLHNPSNHPLREAPMTLRQDKMGLIERQCEHGIGHPDPDSVDYYVALTGEDHWGVHGCDGCCHY